MSSSLYRLIIATTLSSLYQLGHQLALAFSRTEVLHIAFELNKLFALIIGSQKLLADQHLSNLVVLKQKSYPHVLQKKATKRSHK